VTTAAAAERPSRRRAGPTTVARGHLEYHLLVLVSLALVAFGLVMVYSASSGRAIVGESDPMYYLKRQAIFAVAGLALMVVFSRLDFRSLRLLAPPLLIGSAVLLVAVLVLASQVNGARRWLTVGPVAIQPSEFAKLALALWVAGVLSRRPVPRTLGEFIRPIGVVTAIACGLILLEPDLGTVIAIAVMVGAMLLVSGAPFRLLVGAGALAFGLAAAAIWLEPYRRTRFLSFLDPWSDPQGAGYQTVQAMISLGSGGPFGVGLGQSVGKVNYLPEAHTDMIFAIIGEELGLIGASLVIAAFAVVGYAGFNIALQCRNLFGKRLAAGITAMILGQAALNVSAVMGLAPLTGIPLPFVSYGGSSLLVTLVCVGILLNIATSHASQIATAEVPDRRRRNRGTRSSVARDRGGADGARRRRRVRGVA
jgi:cell division protein FtsW